MPKLSFQELYCRVYACAKADFDRDLFWHCFYPHARIPGRLLWILYRDFFAEDLGLIQAAGETSSMSALVAEVNAFRHTGHWKGFWKGFLRVRISGSRLLATGASLFDEERPAPGPVPGPAGTTT